MISIIDKTSTSLIILEDMGLNSSADGATYRPKNWVNVVYSAIVIGILFPKNDFTSAEALIRMFISIGAILFTWKMISGLYICLSDNAIEGPDGMLGKRVKFKFSEIDLGKTTANSKKFFLNRNGVAIYSKQGQKLFLSRLVGRYAYQHILKKIGVS